VGVRHAESVAGNAARNVIHQSLRERQIARRPAYFFDIHTPAGIAASEARQRIQRFDIVCSARR